MAIAPKPNEMLASPLKLEPATEESTITPESKPKMAYIPTRIFTL
jgi:hypothetical protein